MDVRGLRSGSDPRTVRIRVGQGDVRGDRRSQQPRILEDGPDRGVENARIDLAERHAP